MKPTSPDEREPEHINPELSERYRAGSREEPSARIDALIAEAARREVEPAPRRPSNNWRVPASLAAVLVIGVSLVFMVQDNEPPTPSLEQFSEEGKLARPAAPSLALKAQPKANGDSRREDRPTRERTARPDRQPDVRDETLPAAPGELARSPAPATAPAATSAAPAESHERTSALDPQREIAPQSNADMKDEAQVQRSTRLREEAAEGLAKKDAEKRSPPQAWLGRIDDLLRTGKHDEARRQLLGFRQQYPDYPLPERLQALLPPERRGP